MRQHRAWLAWLLCAHLMAACGGGGDEATQPPSGNETGGSTIQPPVVAPTPPQDGGDTLRPSTALLRHTGPAGDEIIVTFVADRPLADSVSASVVEVHDGSSGPALFGNPGVRFQQLQQLREDPPTYGLRLNIAATVAANLYRGALSIQLCRDGLACSRPYAQSPVHLPYEIEVLAPPPQILGPQVLEIGGVNGRELSSPLLLTLNPRAPNPTWNVEGVPEWLELLDTRYTPHNGVLELRPTLTSSFTGRRSAQLVFTATVNGQAIAKTVLVEARLDARKLLLERNSMFFSVSPENTDTIMASVVTTGSVDLMPPWQASSDQPWLTVAKESATSRTAAVTIHARALPNDGLNIGYITLVPDNPNIVAPEKMVVSVFKTAAGPANATTVATAGPLGDAVMDPIRPHLYVVEDGEVAVYHLHEARRVGKLGGAGVNPSALAVAANGSHLYIGDAANQAVHVVDLTTGGTVARFPATGQRQFAPMLYMRPDGVGMLLLGGRTPMLAATGEILSSELDALGPITHAAVSADNHMLATVEASGPSPKVWYMAYTELDKSRLRLTSRTQPSAAPASAVEFRSLVLHSAFSTSPYTMLAVSRTPGDRWRCTRWDSLTGKQLDALPTPQDALHVMEYGCIGTDASVHGGQPTYWPIRDDGTPWDASNPPRALATPGSDFVRLLRGAFGFSPYEVGLGSRSITFARSAH